MALTITDPDLIALIRRRTQESGLSIEETLEQALAHTIAEPQTAVAEASPIPDARTVEEDVARHERILALIDFIGQHMDPTLSRQQMDDLLYDEYGLPR